MAEIIESSRIAGVKIVRLKVFRDERGRFLETFRKEWFPERTWSIVQTNRSDSRAGVLRGLHYHFRQVDYWYVAQGRIRVGLADLRKDSPTFGASETVEMGEQNEYGLYIPSGVAHGFYALTDATLIYLVDNYYDGGDEFGVAWDDPDLAVPWNVRAPILSARDRANPRLQEIPAEQRP
ncbi:dTDP-4-dehydrorhamnose 3,5-epimerase family protein [Caldilinea sp.]|uniref:dTDP-4-dehydrorhamnose 3,5-epimerase family protein n=1 Tax=Caldilinea sp. TaxID=2293560 RepID=UPI0021DBF527|nr:dTDP-4-dehydrorhamnose 3,5-epimerase [Caldilinea sp.]GIV68604.1 MAG: dTDP-4-dehydrorhamnose 3,5-epimerase [Caldilinea sp.]